MLMNINEVQYDYLKITRRHEQRTCWKFSQSWDRCEVLKCKRVKFTRMRIQELEFIARNYFLERRCDGNDEYEISWIWNVEDFFQGQFVIVISLLCTVCSIGVRGHCLVLPLNDVALMFFKVHHLLHYNVMSFVRELKLDFMLSQMNSCSKAANELITLVYYQTRHLYCLPSQILCGGVSIAFIWKWERVRRCKKKIHSFFCLFLIFLILDFLQKFN